MANYCLVTKLKGVVDNPNLPKFGEITFKVLQNKRRSFTIRTNDICTVSVTGGLIKTSWSSESGVTSITLNNELKNIYILPNEGVDAEVKLSNKYTITNILFSYVSIDSNEDNSIILNANDFQYSPLTGPITFMQSFNHGASITGNISTIFKSRNDVTTIDFFRSKISGTTEDISNIFSTSLTRISAADSNITGSINHLAKFINLTEIIGGNGVTGTIEEFAPLFLAACTEAGITHKDIIIHQSNVTYEGNRIPDGNNHLIIDNGSWAFTLAS